MAAGFAWLQAARMIGNRLLHAAAAGSLFEPG